MLHELATVATAEAASLRRGRCGLTTPAVVETVRGQRPEAARTHRRHACYALDQLAPYAQARLDDDSLATWRAQHPQHPHRPPAVKEDRPVLIAQEEYVNSRSREQYSVAGSDPAAAEMSPYPTSA